MKIILSRKGFDSVNGKLGSSILEDGTLLSFLIPSNDTDTFDDLVYKDHTYKKNIKGAGILSYRKDRILTAYNSSKATWVKRNVYDVDNIIGNRKNSSKKENSIYYAGIWQELGLKETIETENWAKSIIK